MNIDIATLRKNTTPPPPPDPGPAPFWDAVGAAWRKQTVVSDTAGYENRLRQKLMVEMLNKLSPASREAVAQQTNGRKFADPLAANIALVTDAASREVPTDPVKWGNYPLDPRQFQDRVDGQRQAELADAQSVLDRPGGGFAEFLGSSARSVVDPVNLALAPLGLEGGAARVIAGEALLNGLAEGLNVPREQQVADELGLPKPNLLARIAEGTAIGGVFGAVAHGVVRAASYLWARRAAARATAPDGIHPIDHEAEIQATQNAMTDTMSTAQTLADNARQNGTGRPLAMSDFDFSSAGNASPRTNRVGYVYGRLLEMGYEPQVAAGFVGNGMVESSPALHANAIGDGGNALGFLQWNGPRKAALEDFAAKAGKPATDLDTQINFLKHELDGPEAAAWAQIRAAKSPEEAASLISNLFERPGVPHLERRVAHARDVYSQFEAGTVPKWTGVLIDDGAPATTYRTSRGYTGDGQVSTPSGRRIDVKYEVVDASLLRRATGDLQPRDRSRANSDAWIKETAARLDPAQLMPGPNAATGAPIVGPDNIIESGNGRVGAIIHAYENFPDRGAAYRQAIEDLTGQPIPDGIRQPVLVARRTSDLAPADRRTWVIDAQDSGVARMTPTEIAQTTARSMTPETLSRLNPAQDLFHPANAGFVREALTALPASERNAMFDGAGALNKTGREQLRDAMFARAWVAPDILARQTETDAGELKSLMDALQAAAPEWAALKADIEAGRVRADADISPYVLDAMRVIAAARDVAQNDGLGMADAVREVLNQIDMFEGAVSPLTVALVRNKFWKNGKAASAAEIGDFLKRYASEARKVAATDTMLAATTPEILRKIDPAVFGDLPDDIGAPRPVMTRGQAETAPPLPETAYAKGAQSPEAEVADQAAFDELRGVGTEQGAKKPDPNNPKLVDTRGSGERFHGSRSGDLPNVLDEYTYSTGNIYGQGFYTTDAVAIANGYGKKGGGTVYRVDEIRPVHAFDMEQPIPPFLLDAAQAERGDLGQLVEDALSENPPSVRAFYDEIRAWSSSNGIPADDVQEMFGSFSEIFRQQGFNALDHTGGLNTKREPHQVRIYLDPRHDIEISKVDLADHAMPAQLRGAVAHGDQAARPLPDLSGTRPADLVPSLAAAQPFDTLDEAYARAAAVQRDLVAEGQKIAHELGVEFKNPGLKGRADAEDKIGRKGYGSLRQITDVSRAGFVVPDLARSDALIARLADRFTVVDEGWTIKWASNYVDRKVIIRHADGMLSEVQIWTPAMKAAKDVETATYTAARGMDPASPEAAAMIGKSREAYSAAMRADRIDLAIFRPDGTSIEPKLFPNAVSKAEGSLPPGDVRATSVASTLTHGAPGDSMATAASPAVGSMINIAGRPSQLQKPSRFMGSDPFIQDTPKMGLSPDEVNQLHADFGQLAVRLSPDGPEESVSDILDGIEADHNLADLLAACNPKGGA